MTNLTTFLGQISTQSTILSDSVDGIPIVVYDSFGTLPLSGVTHGTTVLIDSGNQYFIFDSGWYLVTTGDSGLDYS